MVAVRSFKRPESVGFRLLSPVEPPCTEMSSSEESVSKLSMYSVFIQRLIFKKGYYIDYHTKLFIMFLATQNGGLYKRAVGVYARRRACGGGKKKRAPGPGGAPDELV